MHGSAAAALSPQPGEGHVNTVDFLVNLKSSRGAFQRGGKESKAMRRDAQLAPANNEELIGPEVEKARAARENLVQARQARRDRKAAAKEASVRADPDSWACTYCYQAVPGSTTGEERDTLSRGDSNDCYACGRERDLSSWFPDWRWLCVKCSRDDFTMPGNIAVCRECGAEEDWSVNTYKSVAAPLRPAEKPEAGQGRKRKKRSGKAHKGEKLRRAARRAADAAEEEEAADDEQSDPPEDEPTPGGASSHGGGSGSGLLGSRTILGIGIISLAFRPGDCIQLGVCEGLSSVGLLVGGLLLGQRTYTPFNIVMSSVENRTAAVTNTIGDSTEEAIEAVTTAGIGLIPFVVTSAIRLVLAFLRQSTTK